MRISMQRVCYAVGILLVFSMLASCASGGASAKASTSADPAGGSHEQRTYISTNARLAKYSAVFVENAVMNTTTNRNEKVENFLSQLQSAINSSVLQSVEATGRFETVTAKKQVAQSKGRYLVCRSDVMVHFGSTAARLMVGFGAGRSKLIVVHSLEDPETKEVLLKYTGWGGAVGGFGAQILDKMRVDAMSISNYFGGLVRSMPK